VAVRAVVRERHEDEDWGVLDSSETPGGCWAHWSCVAVDGIRARTPGQDVERERERADQDGYDYRALQTWPVRVDSLEQDSPALHASAERGLTMITGVILLFLGVLFFWVAGHSTRDTVDRTKAPGLRLPSTLRNQEAWLASHRKIAPLMWVIGAITSVAGVSLFLVPGFRATRSSYHGESRRHFSRLGQLSPEFEWLGQHPLSPNSGQRTNRSPLLKDTDCPPPVNTRDCRTAGDTRPAMCSSCAPAASSWRRCRRLRPTRTHHQAEGWHITGGGASSRAGAAATTSMTSSTTTADRPTVDPHPGRRLTSRDTLRPWPRRSPSAPTRTPVAPSPP